MRPGFTLNPIDEYVESIKRRVRDNAGYCLYAEKGDKKNKCPKPCKRSDVCPCGMFIKSLQNDDSETKGS